MFGFHEYFQIVQTIGPEDTVLIDPRIDGAQRFRIELIHPVATLAVFSDEVGAAEQFQVFGDCRPRDRKSAGDLPRGLTSAPQQIQNCAPRGIGQRLKGDFVISPSQMCNRTVTHNA